jgi:hypothetical protein
LVVIHCMQSKPYRWSYQGGFVKKITATSVHEQIQASMITRVAIIAAIATLSDALTDGSN